MQCKYFLSNCKGKQLVYGKETKKLRILEQVQRQGGAQFMQNTVTFRFCNLSTSTTKINWKVDKLCASLSTYVSIKKNLCIV